MVSSRAILSAISVVTASAETSSPTTSPTQAPWDLKFSNMSFGYLIDSAEELVLNFEKGKGRDFDFQLYAGSCETKPRVAIDMEYTKTNSTVNSDKPSMEGLIVKYDFNKTLLGGSNIWNKNTSMVELCQITQLIIPDPLMVITEDIRDIDIDFDMNVAFSIGVGLAPATITAANDTTDLASYVEAYQCEGMGTSNLTADLAPNSELHLCIKSKSTDVEIQSLNTMVIKGFDVAGAASTLPVIATSRPRFPSITSTEYEPAGSEMSVSTRVPIGMFNYDALNASISVSGNVEMRLTGSKETPRRLGMGGGRALQVAAGESEEVLFDLTIKLQPLTEMELGAISAGAVGRNSFFVLGVIIAFACAVC